MRALEAVLAETNDVQSQMRIVSTYLYALVTTDSRDDQAAANMVELQTRSAALGPLMKRLGAWLAALDVDGVHRAQQRSPPSTRSRSGRRPKAPSCQMSEAEESLAAELAPSGSLAWQRLHGDVSSQLMVDVTVDGSDRAGPDGDGARPRDPSRRRRAARAAYEGELAAWETAAVPLAAALNGAKGELAVLNRRRGFVDDLEPNLRANNVDRATRRRDDDGGGRRRCPTSAATSAPRAGCSATPTGCRGGTSSRRSATSRRCRGTTPPTLVLDAFGGYSPDLAGLADARVLASTGSTPRSATASAAVRTARRSTRTSAV